MTTDTQTPALPYGITDVDLLEQIESENINLHHLAAVRSVTGGTMADALEQFDDYTVYTDDEADEAVRENIEQSLWAFNAEFIIDFARGEAEVMFRSDEIQAAIDSLRYAQEKCCEDANGLVLMLINGQIDSFAEAAVSADGRGHYLSSYDGEEHEFTDVNGVTLYVYRQ